MAAAAAVATQGAAPLHIAAAAGLMEPAALLLERGAAIDLATPATQGNSPLHFAIGYGQPKVRAWGRLAAWCGGSSEDRQRVQRAPILRHVP